MGSETRMFTFNRVPKKELEAQWKQLTESDTYERGHDYYNGALHLIEGLTYLAQPFSTFKNAEAFLESEYHGKCTAKVAQIGNPEQFSMEADTRGRALKLALDEALLVQKAFCAGLIQRTLTQKSATKGCKACGCSFSKKGLLFGWHEFRTLPSSASNATLVDRLDRLANSRLEDSFDTRRYAQNPLKSGLFSCPICADMNFVVTATDTKRYESLTAKTSKVRAQFDSHHQKLKAKWAQVKGEHGWAVYATVPS